MLTKQDTKRLAEKAREWVQSPEGQATINEGQERAHRTSQKLRESLRVSQEQMNRRITI